MVMSKVKYEAIRQQRMEENKRKLEQLHLPLLSQALQKASSPKPSPVLNTLILYIQVVKMTSFCFSVADFFEFFFV